MGMAASARKAKIQDFSKSPAMAARVTGIPSVTHVLFLGLPAGEVTNRRVNHCNDYDIEEETHQGFADRVRALIDLDELVNGVEQGNDKYRPANESIW